MEQRIIKAITDLGYNNSLDSNEFVVILEEGPRNIEYTKIIKYLTNELRSLCNIDEEVNVIAAPEDAMSFIMELTSFLKELGCSHDCLTQGYVSDRLISIDDKVLVLDYLLTELMAARMLQETLPDKKIELKLQESTQACNLRKMLMALRFPKPPANVTISELFLKLHPTIQTIIDKTKGELLGHPICNFTINQKHWVTLDKIQKELHSEYTLRREMLLKRLDCTIQSFQWSDKMKGRDELITMTYSDKRRQLKVEPDVNISDLLSARDDLAIIEKTSNASVRKNTKSDINKVIIGQVPDRGGRTSEQAPPPPEMPSWQQRSADPSRGGRGGQFGRGRGRGNYNRGGNSTGGGSNHGDNYSRGGGNNQRDSGNNQRDGGNNQRDGGNNQRDGGRGGHQGGNDKMETNSDTSPRGGRGYTRGGDNYGRGGDNYSRRSNNYSYRGSGSESYSGQGSSDGFGYNREDSYSRLSDSYRRLSDLQNKPTSVTYATYGGTFSKGLKTPDTYSKIGSGSYLSGSSLSKNYDSAGSFSTSYGGNYGSKQQSYSTSGSIGGDVRRTSTGSTGNNDYQTEPKRPKTFDSFQSSKTTYADQYVQESQHNKQNQSMDRGGSPRGGRGYSSNDKRGTGEKTPEN